MSTLFLQPCSLPSFTHSTGMHGAPPSARELRAQQGPNYRVGWGIKAAAEHLQGPTHPTPRRARRSGKGVYSGGTACANADTRRGCLLRKLEGALGAWRRRREGRLQGQLSGGHRPPAKECGPHRTRRLRALRPRSSIRLYLQPCNRSPHRSQPAKPALSRHEEPFRGSTPSSKSEPLTVAGRHTAWPACHPPGQPADLLPVPPTGQISPPQGLCTCSPAASNAPLLTLLELLARICPQVTFPGKPSLSSSCTPAASSPSSEHQSLGHQLPAQVSTCLGSLQATRLHFPDRQGHTPSHQYCVRAPPTRPCTKQVSPKSL